MLGGRAGVSSARRRPDARQGSGRGGGIKAVEGSRYVIGYNARREAICLHLDPRKHTPVSRDILRAMAIEQVWITSPESAEAAVREVLRSAYRWGAPVAAIITRDASGGLFHPSREGQAGC